MIVKTVASEKAMKLMDTENTLLFVVDRRSSKKELKGYVEKMFSVKVESIRTSIRDNVKYAYVRFAKENPAIDIATKLGMI